ncbi:Cyanide hydratase [Clonorchis sinensis]|uniref:Cyanide hydratase n=2 Tax=Clonorchis sinensis TaxID=79923 RepID=A0A8T1N134_CLOSI|nr:Cyanide hydratase [Clonorchis sinensis]GAA57421.1 solute carrier family 5 (high affinity choline transporter) member 7 [Clonorchis sinensis]
MLYIPGLIAIIIFYLLILLVGFWAARKSRSNPAGTTETEDVMLAGRNIGLIVGIFTMTATWVGGGYINGTAENTFRPGQGLVWCQAPIGYAASLVLGGFFFAKRMRSLAFVTMLDPFQNKYGERMCGLLFIPALLGETFWSAAILSALGATLGVIVELDHTTSVIISACIALLYTLFGGLYSVAYTDVVQLFCIFVGLWISLPFALLNKATVPISQTWDRWKGSVEAVDAGIYVDNLLMLTFGGIPWQVYFQRVLSCRTAKQAQILSFVAAIGCLIMALPSVLIGAVGASTDWNMTGYGRAENFTIPDGEAKLVLPLVLRYLCPVWVSFVGLGAVSAAVMSSSDSSVLSAASMFARNVVKPVFWQSATERQIIWVMRASIFGVGALSCLLAICIQSIYGLWYLCSDLIYVILFPQLICVLYVRFSNTYGSLIGYILGLFVRLTSGEALLGLPALFKYPYFYDDPQDFYQRFPCKTFAMLCTLVVTIVVSYFTDLYFRKDSKRLKYDFFHCYKQRASASGSIHIGNRFNRPSIRTAKLPIQVPEVDSENADVDENSNKNSNTLDNNKPLA